MWIINNMVEYGTYYINAISLVNNPAINNKLPLPSYEYILTRSDQSR